MAKRGRKSAAERAVAPMVDLAKRRVEPRRDAPADVRARKQAASSLHSQLGCVCARKLALTPRLSAARPPTAARQILERLAYDICDATVDYQQAVMDGLRRSQPDLKWPLHLPLCRPAFCARLQARFRILLVTQNEHRHSLGRQRHEVGHKRVVAV